FVSGELQAATSASKSSNTMPIPRTCRGTNAWQSRRVGGTGSGLCCSENVKLWLVSAGTGSTCSSIMAAFTTSAATRPRPVIRAWVGPDKNECARILKGKAKKARDYDLAGAELWLLVVCERCEPGCRAPEAIRGPILFFPGSPSLAARDNGAAWPACSCLVL